MSDVAIVENNVKGVDDENGHTDNNETVNISKGRDSTDVVNSTGDTSKEDANNIKGANEIADVNKSVNECESETYVSNPDLISQPPLGNQASPEERTDMGSECSVKSAIMVSDQSSLSIFKHTKI